MTDRQRDKLNMYVLVKDFLPSITTITSRWAIFATLYTEFIEIVAQIFTISGQQQDDYTGITQQKRQIHSKLVDKIEDLSVKGKAYAVVNEDVAFLNLIKFTKGVLQRMADADLVKTAETFHTNMLPKLADLADYDLVQADLDELLTLKNDFLAIYTQPRGKIKETRMLTSTLDKFFGQADKLLLKMDALVQSVQKKEPDIVEEYLKKRTISRTARRTRALQFTVFNDATGERLPKAKITIIAKAGADLTKVVKRSGAQGMAGNNNMADGEYLYTVEYNGMQKESGTFFVNAGIMTRVEVRMKESEK